MRSVVMATYQGARYISFQIESILRQLAPDDEVIISDDASTDETMSIVHGFADSRIRTFMNSTRVGYVKNFENAVRQSRGNEIFFSDQDDVWLPGKADALTAALRAKCVAISDVIVVDKDLRELHKSYFQFRNARWFTSLALFARPKAIGASMACRRQYLVSQLPFPKGIPHDFWISVNAAWDGTLAVIDTPLMLYRRHPQTASVSATHAQRRKLTILSERASLAVYMIRRRLATCFSRRRNHVD